MTRFGRALLLGTGLGCFLYGQAPGPATSNGPADKRAGAYYNFAMGRLYTELAGSSGNSREYISKAIQFYQDALKQDPTSSAVFDELTELYISTNRMREAAALAEEILKQNPDNLGARRMLGRVYTRMLGDTQQGRVNEDLLRRATEQYLKITEKDPKDADSWVMLGKLYRVAQKSVERCQAGSRQVESRHRPASE